MALHLEHRPTNWWPDQRDVIVERALWMIDRELGGLTLEQQIAVTRILEQLRFDSATSDGWFW
jgi:hypothetical protein